MWTYKRPNCALLTSNRRQTCYLCFRLLMLQGTDWSRHTQVQMIHTPCHWGRGGSTRILTKWSSGKFLPQQNLVHLMPSQVNKTHHPSVHGNGFLWLSQSTELSETLSDPSPMLQKMGRKQPLWLFFPPLYSLERESTLGFILSCYLWWHFMYSIQQRSPVGQLLLKVSTLTKELTTSSDYSGKEHNKNIFCHFRQIIPDPCRTHYQRGKCIFKNGITKPEFSEDNF